jgi:DNA polymerase-3 subunit beta
MKVATRKDVIESILINAQPFLERKDPTNITSHIYFDASSEDVIIRATDSEIGLEVKSNQFEIIEPGIFTANGKKLLDIVRTLKDDTIEFEVKDGNLIIKQKSTKFKLPTFAHEEYPIFPNIDNKAQISLDSLQLIKSFKKITPAIDINNPKYELNGALLDIKEDKTFFVGTDTRRLAIVELDNQSNEELAIIIPKKAIIEIQKLFLDKIDIYYDENSIIVKNDQFFLYSRLINGKFPDYQRIIPQSTKYNLTIPKKEILEAMKVINIISPEIKITFEPNLIILESLNSDIQEAKTSIETPISINESFTLAVNSKYLFDFISQVDEENFTMGLNEPSLPFVVRSGNFLTVIMPILL